MCEAITRINWKLTVGNFEMNINDGLLQFRPSCRCTAPYPCPNRCLHHRGGPDEQFSAYGLAVVEAALTDHEVEWLLTRAEKQSTDEQKP